MSNLVVIDSSVLVSFIVTRDLKHEAAEKIIQNIFDPEQCNHVIIPPLVLYETGVVVTRVRYDSAQLADLAAHHGQAVTTAWPTIVNR